MATVNNIIGIDLGTTYSCVAVVDEHGKPVVVPNQDNERVTPSVVHFDADNRVVGREAKELAQVQPDDVVALIKREMGSADWIYEYNGQTYRPEEISSYILRKLVSDTEQELGREIKEAVITCPAYFGVNEREATKQAGIIAGLEVRHVFNEPTAAALFYGSLEDTSSKVVLVYDLGGGTFDVTLINVTPDSVDVVATGGNRRLGGKDWDDKVVAYLAQQYAERCNLSEDIMEDPQTLQDLMLRAERAKISLAKKEVVKVPVAHKGERQTIELTLEKFDELTSDLLEQTISLTQEMLSETDGKFDEILLVGGSSRMPQIKARVDQEFDVEAKLFEPDEAVAKGAALYGWKLALGDAVIDRLAEKTGRSRDELEEKRKNGTLDEAQVKDAARDVADETGYTIDQVEDSVDKPFKDVASKSFGVVVLNRNDEDEVNNLIFKNQQVPAEKSERFGTRVENQSNASIRIMESEYTDKSLRLDQAVEIGSAILDLPAGLPKGAPLEITYKLNEEGRLDMRAVELKESREVTLTLETNAVMQEEDLEEAKGRASGITVN